MSAPDDSGFSEADVRVILGRAIELDARGPTMTREDLYGVAAELGIARAALDTALAERSKASSGVDLRRGKRAATLIAGLGLPLGAFAGAVLAGMGSFAAGPFVALAVGGGLLGSGGLLILQGREVTLGSFVARNTELWAGFVSGGLAAVAVLGGTAAVELPWLITMTRGAGGWLGSTIVGCAAVLAIRRALRPTSSPGTDDELRGVFAPVRRALLRLASSVMSRPTCLFQIVSLRGRMAPEGPPRTPEAVHSAGSSA
jgi:hypothetical protein